MITVFTPTYNRANTLERLYNSLKETKEKLVWLVVDDGSTDNTEELMKSFKDSKVSINYVKKENGGKMSAFNLAIDLCETEYFMTIDSDDMINPNFIKEFYSDIDKIKDNDNIAAIVYLAANMNNKDEVVGTKLPDNTICKFYDIYNKFKVKGDKSIVWKTDVLKKYKYPMIDGEKFIADAYLMNEVSFSYDFMTINRIATFVEYQDNGYSANYFNLVRKNPKGNRLYFKQLYSIKKSWYNVYGYILFSIYSKTGFKNTVKEHPAKIKTILLYLPTLIVSKIK